MANPAGAAAPEQVSGDELAFAGAARQAQLVRDKEVSPRELVELYLRRIERLEPRLNAFRVVLAERALAEADQAEARLRAGEERPLLGVPLALKDGHDLAGEISTHGTDCFDSPVGEDAEMVARLRGAGAIVIGKTNLPELAISGFTESATWGVTRNPWDLQRSPGGSSGGSASAVAAGLAAIATASDGAGSIRIPAASCGLFGLKPTRGRIPLVPDLYAPEGEHWNGMTANGCVSRTVLDTAIFLDVTSGGSRERGAPPAPDAPFAEAARPPAKRLRVAWSLAAPRMLLPARLDGGVERAVAGTAELLRDLGHEVAQDDPDYGSVGDRVTVRYLRGVYDDVKLTPHPERLERRTHGYARLGRLIPASQRRRAVEAAAEDRRRINAIFERHDVLLIPAMAGPAVRVRRWEGRGVVRSTVGQSRHYPFTAPWNHLGNPAAAVPAGFTPDGLPLSVQLVAPPGREDLLLSLAAQLEAERPWADLRPPLS